MKTLAELSTLLTLEKICNVLRAVSDISIAGALVFLLRQSRTGFKRSESIVNKLIIFSINTGAVTTLCAIMALIFVSRRFFSSISFPPMCPFLSMRRRAEIMQSCGSLIVDPISWYVVAKDEDRGRSSLAYMFRVSFCMRRYVGLI